MADYYPLLSRAVAGLPADQPEARQAIYARAREAMERHLGNASPALDEADILKEKLALEDVIRRIEQETEERAKSADEPVTVDNTPPSITEQEAAAAPPAAAEDLPDMRAPHVEFDSEPVQADEKPSIPIVQPLPPQSSPRPKLPDGEKQQASRRTWGMVAVIGAVLVCAMGAIAYIKRENPAKYSATVAVQQPAEQPSDSSKREGRLAGSDTPADPTPAPQPQRPSANPSAAQSTPPAANPPAAPSQAAPALPIASRAFMVLEVPGGAPNQYEGQANWTFAPDSNGKANSRTLRASIEFAAAGLNVDFSLSENKDAALNASHTIFIAFEPRPGLPDIRAMSAIEWRERENQAGITFAGVLVPVQDNMFMIGLDKSDFARKRNLDLLRNQKWMVFEFGLSNNRRGAMLIEKGSSGERAVGEALAVWQ